MLENLEKDTSDKMEKAIESLQGRTEKDPHRKSPSGYARTC